MAQQQTIGKTATRVFKADGVTVVQYHSTEVVKFDAMGVWLYTGGWKSNTTKARMNQASNQFGLGYSVYQRDFEWFVDYKGKTYQFQGDGLYFDR